MIVVTISVLTGLVGIGMTLLSIKYMKLDPISKKLSYELSHFNILIFVGCGFTLASGGFGFIIFSKPRSIVCNILFSLFIATSAILLLYNSL